MTLRLRPTEHAALQEAERRRDALFLELEMGGADRETIRRMLGQVACAYLDASHSMASTPPAPETKGDDR